MVFELQHFLVELNKETTVLEIILRLDYMSGPVWTLYNKGLEVLESTGISVIDNDEEVLKLNEAIRELYNSYYSFDVEGQPCSFDEAKEKNDKERMLKLLGQLKKRLSDINDGSFEVIDEETSRVSKL